MTLDKANTLYFLLSYLRKITVCRSSFAKIHFKRFPECLFSHQFLKLSLQSSSLLHLSLRFFLPGPLGEIKPSYSALNDCSLALWVLWISLSSLAIDFGSPFSIRSTFISNKRALDLTTRTTTSTRFNLNCFRVFSNNIYLGKLHCTIFHLKKMPLFLLEKVSLFPGRKTIKLQKLDNLLPPPPHYDILAKTRSRMTTDDVGSRARTT